MNPKPSKEQIKAARNKSVPDVIAPGLTILFCGINPGLYTAAIQCHFGRPGNRFWPALYAGGLTPRLYDPSEQHELLKLKLGITNLVNRATNLASELSITELKKGSETLTAKVIKYKPKVVAVVGIDSYRKAFGRPNASLGLQPQTIGATHVWVLPNPSGLNAHYTPSNLAILFRALKVFANKN